MQIILYIIPLFFILLLIYRPLTFKNTQVLLLIGMIFEALTYTLLEYNILYIIVYAVVGEILHFTAIGIFSTNVFKKNYQILLLAIGLFPLLLSIKITIVYLSALIIFTLLTKIIKVYKSGENYHIKTLNKELVKGKLSPTNYQDYLKGRKISLLLPFLTANAIAIIIAIFLFI